MWQALLGAVLNKVGDKNAQSGQVANGMADSMNGIRDVESNLQNLNWENAMQFPQYKGFGGF